MIYCIQKKGKGFEFEMCRQVRFRIIDSSIGDTTEILGGIGIYEDADNENDERLINVICGCCGSVLEPEDVKILEKYHSWIDICDAIIGN